MVRWLRVLFSVFALCGPLVAGGGGAMAAKAHHSCCPGMSAEMAAKMAPTHHHAHTDDHDAAPKCCLCGLCVVSTPLALRQDHAAPPRLSVRVSFPNPDVPGLPSRASSPDLRPPIA